MRVLSSILKERRQAVYLSLSLLMILLIFINSIFPRSPLLGTPASIVYFLINGYMLGNAFFKDEEKLKVPLGILTLIALLGIFGWLFIVFYRLRITETTIVLFVASIFSFLINRVFEKKIGLGILKRVRLRRKSKG